MLLGFLALRMVRLGINQARPSIPINFAAHGLPLHLPAGTAANKDSRPSRHHPPAGLQVPDFVNARIDQKPAIDVIGDMNWFREEFTPKVATRGGALIKKWGRSSAASTAVSIAGECGHNRTLLSACRTACLGFTCGLFVSIPLFWMPHVLTICWCFSFPSTLNALTW